MKEEKRKAPKLRFPGFERDWEQRRLSEMSDFITKGATPTTYGFDWVDEGIPFFRNDAIKDNQFVYGDFSYISEEANEVLSRSEISGDDILVAITGDIGKVGIVPKTIKKANINQHTARVRIVRDSIPYFVYQSLAREEQQTIYQKIKTGLSMPQLSLEQIRETPIMCPSFEEQTKIVDVLYNFDNLITLHQRKLDQIKEYKKGMLQKMFPKKGETVPEVRFPEFEGDWEEKKLGQLFSFVKTKNTNGLIDNVITNSAEYGLIPQREYFDKDIAVEGHTDNYTIIEKGNFVYNPRKSTSAPYGPFNCYMLDERGVVSPLYTCLDLKNPGYAEYLIWYFKTDKWHPYIQNNGAQGGARHDRVGMTNELMKGIPILLPSVSEQKKIGEFFENLDSLIFLHQQKLDEMKEYKKGLLQQMFV